METIEHISKQVHEINFVIEAIISNEEEGIEDRLKKLRSLQEFGINMLSEAQKVINKTKRY